MERKRRKKIDPYRTEVDNESLANMLVMSFRYALGRMTYVPVEILELMQRHGKILKQWRRDQIVRDIDWAVKNGMAGAECDVRVWMQVRAVLEEMNLTELEKQHGQG